MDTTVPECATDAPSQSTVTAPILAALSALCAEASALERQFEATLSQLPDDSRDSARNLIHYVAMRRHDLRELQGRLASLGLSSLGRLESHVLSGIKAVLHAARLLADAAPQPGRPINDEPQTAGISGPALLERHAEQLLGKAPAGRRSRIMVTMPRAAADREGALIHDLMAAGMDVMRINAAHDDPGTWSAMVARLREAEAALGRRCLISFDLAGPKMRTGPTPGGAEVLKVKPHRDALGRVVRPARILLTSKPSIHAAEVGVDAILPVGQEPLDAARTGDVVSLTDSRSRRRQLNVVMLHDAGLIVETERTTYFITGMELLLLRGSSIIARCLIDRLPPSASPLVLHAGDTLILRRDGSLGRAATRDGEGRVVEPASISCSLEDSFGDVLPGHRILFDDGKIGGVVESNDGDRIIVRIQQAPAKGAKLGSQKGINLPDSDLSTSALTRDDLQALDFAIQHADIICLSFIRRPEDVEAFVAELDRRGGRHIGIVLKIETRQAFENLPRILLASLRSPPVGVMLARGDLAVEIGFERLAEVQEEILWLCEAAHVPVVWATQVLEGLAKTGSPSRAEVTDAAMSGRAECVMLNKGPYIVEAVKFLDGVLRRMHHHQQKKTAMLRQLSISSLQLQRQS